jgi:iron complex transport system ATP-binding protein
LKKIIEIHNAAFGYKVNLKSNRLLYNINVSANKGDNIALIGVNGSGKSTLLKTIAKLNPLLNGEILVDNTDINSYKIKEYAKITSFVSSEIIKTSFLSVFDLVAMGRFPHQNFMNSLNAIDKDMVFDALHLTDTISLKDRHINELSDGERQKVMIARALAQDTNIILLDEPTSFLDLSNKFNVYRLLNKIASEKNKTVIFSTHDLNIAIKYAHKIWLIKNHGILEGSPEDLILNNAFIDLFEKKFVYFNIESNEFNVKFEAKYPIKIKNLSGSEKLYKLTLNALQKIGVYESDMEKNIMLTINNNNTWNFVFGNIFASSDNLYDTMKIIKKNLTP